MSNFVATQITYMLYLIPYWIIRFVIFLLLIWSSYRQTNTDEIFQTNYDYIIVGAGTAGTIVFSEMPADLSVLLIEAGTEPILGLIDIPIMAPTLQQTSLDWSYLIEPQENACFAMQDHKCRIAAGRGYGGSNILNNMIYHRGNKNDFEGWFKDSSEFDYEQDVLHLFRELEDDLSPVELKYVTEIGKIFSAPYGFSRNITFVSPKILNKHGYRWSMSNYAKSIQKTVNHKLLTDSQAVKLLFQKTKADLVDSIEIKRNNQIYKLKARKGYILTAGAIETPKLLLNSGIGPCEELTKNFVPCRVDLPGVGKNLQDHIATGLDLITLNSSAGLHPKYALNPQEIYNFLFRDGESLWSTVGCEAIGFYNSKNSSNEKNSLGFMVLPMGISTDAGVILRNNLNIQDQIWNNYFSALQGKEIISVIPIVLKPKSRGYVRLASSDISKPPIINPRYLSNPDDIALLIRGINIIKEEILKNPRLKSLGASITNLHFPECSAFQFDTTKYWECYVKHVSFSAFHVGGTCRLGDPKNSETVVDRTTFLVNGIDNLYIADASVMPNLPSGNPNAAVALIAKKFMAMLKGHSHMKLEETNQETSENIINQSNIKAEL